MPTTQDRPIIKCPHCDSEIENLQFSAAAREDGTCSVFAEPQTRRVGTGSRARFENIPGEFRAETEDFDTEDTEWTGDTEYYCPDCGDNISLSQLIIVSNEVEEEEEEEEIDPDDAVETKTNIVLSKKCNEERWDKSIPGLPINADQIDGYVCEECGHIFVTGQRYTMGDTFIACPLCGSESNVKQNRDKILAKAN